MKLLEQLMPSGITRSMGLHPGYETGASRHNAEVSFVVARGDCGVDVPFRLVPEGNPKAPEDGKL